MSLFATLRRLLSAFPWLVLGGVGGGACSSSHFEFEAPLGYAEAPASFGACKTDDGYAALPDPNEYCGKAFPGCTGTTYAICDGSAWSGCICAIPAYYTEVNDPVFGLGDGGGDAAGQGGATSSGGRP